MSVTLETFHDFKARTDSREEQYMNMFAMFFSLDTLQLDRGEMSFNDLHPSNMLFMLYTFDTSHNSREVMSTRDSHPLNIPSMFSTSPKPNAMIALRLASPS